MTKKSHFKEGESPTRKSVSPGVRVVDCEPAYALVHNDVERGIVVLSLQIIWHNRAAFLLTISQNGVYCFQNTPSGGWGG